MQVAITGRETPVKKAGNTFIRQEALIDQPIEKAWQLLGPGFADAQKWASFVQHSEARDNHSVNGSTCSERGCSVKGMGSVREKILQYSEDEHLIAYQVYQGMPSMVKYASSTWRLTEMGNRKTKVELLVEMQFGGLLGALMGGMMKLRMTKLAKDAVEEFKYYLEKGVVHPRKSGRGR